MSTSKATRLLKALSNESVRRLPYIFFVLIVLSLIQFTRLELQTAHNGVDSKALLKKVASLSEDNKQLITQNKKLTEQNIQIASANAQHLDCLADLFARYTRNASPIYQIDLDNCKINQGSVQSGATTEQPSAQSSSPSSSVPASSSPKSTPSSTPSQPVISQPPQPSLLQQIGNTGSRLLKAIGL